MKSIPYSRQQPDFTKKYYSCVNADNKKDSSCVKHVYISNKNNLDVVVCYIGKPFHLLLHTKVYIKTQKDTTRIIF